MSLWSDDEVQFARLIAEMEAAGVFNVLDVREIAGHPTVKESLLDSMDLDWDEVMEVVDRAQEVWDFLKEAI